MLETEGLLTHPLHHVLTPSPPPHPISILTHPTRLISSFTHSLLALSFDFTLTSTKMGCCISSGSDRSRNQEPCATVISVAGELRRYPLPITASQVITFETSSPDSVFLCNSDRLYFDDYIPRLDAEEPLEPDQIYFVMPASRLQSRLAASDMAALAVKASAAFNDFNPRRSRKSRISPVLVAEEDPRSIHPIKISGDSSVHAKHQRKAAPSPSGISRSGSVRKLHRYSSRRAKLAVRSFRIRLNTINEGSILLN